MKRLAKIFLLSVILSLFAFNMNGNSITMAQPITFKLGHVDRHEGHVGQVATKIKELAEKMSNGALEVKIYPFAQLGGEREALEGIQLGTIDMTLVPDSMVANFVPEFSVLGLPLLSTDREKYNKFIASPIGQKLLPAGDKKGLKIMWSRVISTQNVTNNVRPIRIASDFKGLKMRTMENPMQMDAMKALGATATPIPFPELYTSLQTGVVEGQFNSYLSIWTRKFYEVQKYLSEVPIITMVFHWVIGVKTWNKLSPEHQKILVNVAAEAGPFQDKVSEEGERKMYEAILATGKIKVNKPESLDSFIEALKPMYTRYLKQNPDWEPIIKAIQGK